MRILHTYRTYFPDTQGGLEETIRQICLTTSELGAECRVLAPSASADRSIIRRPEATVYRPKLTAEVASCSISLAALPRFKELVQWADVVHYHFPWPFADVQHFATRVRKPTILTYHSDIVRQRVLGALYRPLMNRFLGAVDRIVCTSPNYFATSDVLPRFADKVEVIPIGIDEGSYADVEESTLRRVEATHGRDFFLFVGVLRYYKGLHILLDSLRGAPYHVVIVGSGPTERELKRQAERLGLTNVTFTGHVPDEDKISLFKLCRGVIFPSYMRSEAFGVTLLEGAMYGRPLISTEVGSGTSHVNVDGETGLVVPPGSPRALRQAMDQMWYRPDMAERMGRKARGRFERLFTGRVMGSRYHQAYSSLLGRPGDTTPSHAVSAQR